MDKKLVFLNFILINLNPLLSMVLSINIFNKNIRIFKASYINLGVLLSIISLSTYPEMGDSVRYFQLYLETPLDYNEMLVKYKSMYTSNLLFYQVMYIFKKLKLDYIFFVFISSIVVLRNCYHTFLKDRENFKKIDKLLIMVLTYSLIIGAINDIRYPLLGSIFGVGIYNYYYLNKKIKGLFYFLITFFMHKSMIIIPIILLLNVSKVRKIILKNRKLIYIIALIGLPMIKKILNIITITNPTINKLQYYIQSSGFLKGVLFNKYSFVLVIIDRFVFLGIILFILTFSLKNLNNKNLKSYFFLYMLGLISVVFLTSSVIFGRINFLLLIYLAIFLTNLSINNKGYYKNYYIYTITLLTLKLIILLMLLLYGGLIRSFKYDSMVPNYLYQPFFYQIFMDKKLSDENLNMKIPLKQRKLNLSDN